MFEIKFRMISLLSMAMAIYMLGMITAQYKLFPYHEIRSVKNFIVGDISANADVAKHTIDYPYYGSMSYHRKKSFFEQFKPDANVIMFGDSKTDLAEWPSIFPGEKIANYGISGDTTAGALHRMQQINIQNNSKVFIMLGINDLLGGEEIENVFNNYKKIVDYLLIGDAKIYIQSTLFISEQKSRQHKDDTINHKVSRLNEMLKYIAEKNEQVTYIDLNTFLSGKSYLDKKYTVKGRSLNGEGYRVWSNLIRPYIISDKTVS